MIFSESVLSAGGFVTLALRVTTNRRRDQIDSQRGAQLRGLFVERTCGYLSDCFAYRIVGFKQTACQNKYCILSGTWKDDLGLGR